jgi:short-subunit dehydrogenase
MSKAAAVFRPSATALITGAASGVGLAVAKLCASHSMNLILLDWDKDKLAAAQGALHNEGKGTVDTHSIDVSSLDEWAALKSKIEGAGTKLDFLHLNAGVQAKGGWDDSAYFKKILDTNLFGVINGLNTFVNHFDNNNSSPKAVIITGSKQGITNPPGNPAYNASKSAVKTICEHLNFDFAKSAPSTSVHLLVPGWTFTGLTAARGVTEKPDGAWAPEQVADYLYSKMSDGKFYVICPDNDVDWETDRKRMTWTMGDIVYERQPQSRWRDEYKDEANKTMEGMKLGDVQADANK